MRSAKSKRFRRCVRTILKGCPSYGTQARLYCGKAGRAGKETRQQAAYCMRKGRKDWSTSKGLHGLGVLPLLTSPWVLASGAGLLFLLHKNKPSSTPYYVSNDPDRAPPPGIAQGIIDQAIYGPAIYGPYNGGI